MCRLLGVMFAEDNNAEQYLLNSECSLFKQALEGKQSDGWGIGFYADKNPVVYKSEKPVYEDRLRFESAAKSIRSRIIIAHVRRASNPRGLPREMLISPENSQPFNHLNYLFIHNGSINIPDEVLKRVGPYSKLVKSCNDSETYFYLLLSLIEREASITNAVRRVEETLMKISLEDKISRAPFTSLNTIFSDGEHLYAFTRYLSSPSRSICYGDTPVFEMCYRVEEDRIIVASEKTDREDWVPIRNNRLLSCWNDAGGLKHDMLSLNGS